MLGELVENGMRRLARDHLEALAVVLPLDTRPDDALARVDFLLGLEERDGEVLVELLVGEIDEELFERILLKVFEAINVENAENARVGRLGALIHQARVDLLHDPVEQLGVDSLGQRVARVLRLVRLERDLHLLTLELHSARAERLLQQLLVRAQQLGGDAQLLRVGDLRVAVLVLGELDVAQVQQARDGVQKRLGHLLVNLNGGEDLGDDVKLRRVAAAARRRLARVGAHVGVLVRVGVDVVRRAIGGGDELVEDVVVALVGRLLDHARRLEQVGLDRSAEDRALARDVDLRELAKARRILVEHGLGVSEGLE
mmetsp:Transcript_38331/g.84240  ORF Transcript_38331/g.84240 Transcript_38331/m.84240 type:complete len:314 (-) Transcript_38331:767-1708(-)